MGSLPLGTLQLPEALPLPEDLASADPPPSSGLVAGERGVVRSGQVRTFQALRTAREPPRASTGPAGKGSARPAGLGPRFPQQSFRLPGLRQGSLFTLAELCKRDFISICNYTTYLCGYLSLFSSLDLNVEDIRVFAFHRLTKV